MVSRIAVQLALRARLEAVSGIPPKGQRAFENIDFKPTPSTPYITEQFIPQPGVLPGLTRGPSVSFGLYIVTMYGLTKNGISAIGSVVDAILAAFPPGLTFAQLVNGDSIRIRGLPAPSSGQIIPQDDGWAVCAMTIPFRVQSIATP
ncbi:MAG TPA: phage tail terminator-like protein [Gemmatimonadaceae bacterium]|jgi:hypothetical protein